MHNDQGHPHHTPSGPHHHGNSHQDEVNACVPNAHDDNKLSPYTQPSTNQSQKTTFVAIYVAIPVADLEI